VNNYHEFFLKEYEESRERFKNSLNEVKAYNNTAALSMKWVGDSNDDLSIDMIKTDALVEKENLLIITTGLHGIEGYMGAAILQLFMKEYLQLINHQNTGLLLVHALNPWGMKHKRRVNENNVDLNRNFITKWADLDKGLNKQYQQAANFFNQKKQLTSLFKADFLFSINLINHLFKLNTKGLSNAVLLGQYQYPNGIYYGGTSYEQSTEYIFSAFNKYFSIYNNIIVIDIHTGYGPSNQMSIVNSSLEKGNSKDFSKQFTYPLVSKTDSEEFYAINGDMIDYIYTLQKDEFSQKNIYATAFEFGTLGESVLARLSSLKKMIKENQLYWHGARSEEIENRIKQDFLDLFYPSDEKWRAKAISDAKQALNGILKAKGFIYT